MIWRTTIMMQNNNTQTHDPYSHAGYKLKTKELQIEELNRDMIYWNSKMCSTDCPKNIKEANDMIELIRSEFDTLQKDDSNLFSGTFRNDDELIHKHIRKDIENNNKVLDNLIVKGKDNESVKKSMFMCCMRDWFVTVKFVHVKFVFLVVQIYVIIKDWGRKVYVTGRIVETLVYEGQP